jgi:uncharacterized protein (TIGR03790 family)
VFRAIQAVARKLWVMALLLAAATTFGAADPNGVPTDPVPNTDRSPTSELQTRAPGLGPRDLAVIINTADPLSVAIGSYYATQRHIPAANIVKVRFDAQRDELSAAEFNSIWKTIERRLSPGVQAFALTWVRPFRVGCMSITSAFAFGVHDQYCASGCRATQKDPYFDTWHKKPYTDFHIRPAMSIAALSLDQARALIDRGVRSDGQPQRGTAYLVTTTDTRRSVRTAQYPLGQRMGYELHFPVVSGDAPQNPTDVMFYFTGATEVAALEKWGFVPGAVADHLTSFGGVLVNSSQMSSLRWLEAGATGSYGTVVEPCAFPGKFPNVAVLMAHYLAGESLIEAYWKSVAMPGQGIFIGEPLAAPFRDPPGSASRH